MAVPGDPGRDKDLDPAAAEFIVDWSQDVPREAPLALLVHLDRPAGLGNETDVLRDAVHQYSGSVPNVADATCASCCVAGG